MKGEHTRSTLIATAALIGAMTSLALGTSFAKQLFPVVGANGTTALRVMSAAILMLAFARPWRHSLSRQDAFAILLYGVSLGAMNLLFYASLKTIPFGVAVAIEFTGPLGVAVFSSRRKIDFVWIVLAALGLSLIAPLQQGSATLDVTGCAYAFAAGLCWALYIVFGHRLTHLDGGQSTSLGMTTAAVIAAPFGWAQAGAKLFSPSILVLGLVVGVLSSALPYSLEMVALKRLPKRTFSILLSLEPALAALAGLVFLHEQLSTAHWIAIACVIGASVGSATTAERTHAKNVAEALL